MTRAKDISKIVTDANLSGTLDVAGDLTVDTSTLKVDSTNNRVGINTTGSVRDLQIGDNTRSASILSLQTNSTGNGSIYFGDNTTTNAEYAGMIRYSHSDNAMLFWTSSTERMRIDSSGNVGIGTSSPLARLHLKMGGSTRDDGFYITRDTNDNHQLGLWTSGGVMYFDAFSDNPVLSGQFSLRHSRDTGSTTTESIRASDTNVVINEGGVDMDFRVESDNNTHALFVEGSSGNVGIGTSTALSGPSSATALRIGNQISIYELDDGGNPVQMNINQNIDASENYIVSDHAARYQMRDGVHKWFNVASGTAGTATSISGAEKMQLDTSGNLLVGTTSTIPFLLTSGTGAGITSTGTVMAGATAEAGLFNRVGSDGSIINLYKAGSIVGSIGSNSSKLYIAGGDAGFKFRADLTCIMPCNSDGTNSDNDLNLGQASVRWSTIFATNSTINTSDRNEKQDIEELSDAEQRVAVACKGLMRKYRWKSSVAEKGDNARTHFGIIAQDLQDAFTAEGLDASKYAMFCSDTWWELDGEIYQTEEEAPEGATEKTRLGVRYSQLLAFIISAI